MATLKSRHQYKERMNEVNTEEKNTLRNNGISHLPSHKTEMPWAFNLNQYMAVNSTEDVPIV